MRDKLNIILDITDRAARIPRKYFRTGVAVDSKSDASPVTRADRDTETFIRDALGARFPGHAIYGEEFGQTLTDSRYLWVIDPIDGTRSFISGMPLYGMLVALLHDGKPVLGMIRMPELDEVYAAGPDGAFLNGTTPLRTSGVTDLAQAFLYINEADRILADAPRAFARLNQSGRDRRFGYDCYPHALVAAGHADACIDYNLKPYDYLPMVPVVEGAGGVISDWQGQPLSLKSDGRVVSAATPTLHRALLACLE